jgi:hypothetical protein
MRGRAFWRLGTKMLIAGSDIERATVSAPFKIVVTLKGRETPCTLDVSAWVSEQPELQSPATFASGYPSKGGIAWSLGVYLNPIIIAFMMNKRVHWQQGKWVRSGTEQF